MVALWAGFDGGLRKGISSAGWWLAAGTLLPERNGIKWNIIVMGYMPMISTVPEAELHASMIVTLCAQ